MIATSRIKRKRIMQEAQGYLELITLFDDRWPLDLENKRRIADRTIETLGHIENPMGFKPEILYLKGQAHLVAERFAQAVNAFEQSIRTDPENVATFLALGWCYKRLKQLDLAIESLRGAVLLDWECAVGHYNLACYLSLAGDVKEAVKHLAIAFELKPDYRDSVSTEHDFDPIREHPDFQSLLSVAV